MTISLSDHLETMRLRLMSKMEQRPLTRHGSRTWNGVPAPDPLCAPDCPVCRGLGYYRMAIEDIHDPEFGKLHPCPNREVKYNPRCGLSQNELGLFAWGQIKEDGKAPEAAALVQEILVRGHGWVYLWGSYGKAKTLILKIAAAEALQDGTDAAYTRMAEILEHLRGAYDTDYPNQESIKRLDWWANLPLLCIDEFDRVRDTEYASEKRFTLMDRRYEQGLRGESITLMASNKAPHKLDGYLADRIEDGRFAVFHLPGESYRPVMEAKP